MGEVCASVSINDLTVLRSYCLCLSLPVYPLQFGARDQDFVLAEKGGSGGTEIFLAGTPR